MQQTGPDQPTIGLGRLAVAAYAPTLFATTGLGAVYPLIALSARELGASLGVAAFVVALLGIGQMLGDLPAGQVVARFGEKRSVVGACLVDVATFAIAWQAPNVIILGGAVLVTGMSAAVFGLARQAYLANAIPVHHRARAMSTLGGVYRIGMFLGPMSGAVVVTGWGLSAAYLFAALASLIAAGLNLTLPELTPPEVAQDRNPAKPPPGTSFRALLRTHSRLFATLGLGMTMIMMARAARLSLVPLWAESLNITPAMISVIFGISAAADMVLFYPGGMIMDRFGRFWVAVPAMTVIGIGLLLLPFTNSALSLGVVAVVIGFGNGISAGIVLTLGADNAPVHGQAKFLALWRLAADAGNATGPALIAGIAAIAPLAVAAILVGALTLAGGGWLARWLPRNAPLMVK